MKITLSEIGKRYNYEWIFRNINFEFSIGNNYVILGANGSGKSTLLQVIAGNLIPSEGIIKLENGKATEVEQDSIFQQISFAAPYLELFEDFTLYESIEFQANFKSFINNLTILEIISLIQLEKAKNKQLKYFSSGMKQRVKLALAILSDVPVLLLDEPASNLDKNAIDWYNKLISDYAKNKLIVVCSNQQEYEYSFCKEQIIMDDYKIKE